MVVTGLVLAAIAAAVHVYIWVLESLRWEHPATRAVFGTSADEARTTKVLAYNQGFYNLFLAIMVAVGVVLVPVGREVVGHTLVVAGCGSMALAAATLFSSGPRRLRPALVQGLAPALAVVLIAVGLATG